MIDDIAAYIFARTTYEFLLSQFHALAFGWLGRMLLWVHGIGSSLLTLHLMWQGFQLITGHASSSATARVTDSLRAVILLGLAAGTVVGGPTLFQWLSGDLVRAVAALVHGGDGDLLGEVDRNFGYLQLALSSIGEISAPNAEIQAAKDWNMAFVTWGIGGPGLIGMALLLVFDITLCLFVGLGPFFVLCLIWRRTRPLFDGWLLYGLGTMFAMATLAVMLEIALPMVSAVAAAFWTATWTGANPEGVTSLAMQQGGIGLILTTMIISAPVIAARFFKATLGDFVPFSAFMNRMEDRQAAAQSAHAGSSHTHTHERDHAPTHAHRVIAPAQAQADEVKQAADTRSFSERYPNALASLDPPVGRGDPLPDPTLGTAFSTTAQVNADHSTRRFGSAEIEVISESDWSVVRTEKVKGTIVRDLNAIGDMIRKSSDVELADRFRDLKIGVDFDDWKIKYAGTQAENGYGQAYFDSGSVLLNGSRVESALSMHDRVKHTVHELRHLMIENNQLITDSSGTPLDPIEKNAQRFSEEFMKKYWRPEYEFYK